MMHKFAYAGQLHALHQLGLIPQESLGQVSPLALMLSGGQVRLPGAIPQAAPTGQMGMLPGMYGGEQSVYGGEPEATGPGWGKRLRKAGPGIGGILGGLGGALLARRGGAGLKGLAMGALGGGAAGMSAGWAPDVLMSMGEGLSGDVS
jgi:hypothetical protein